MKRGTALLAAFVLAGCGTNTTAPDATDTTDSSKYDQTWSKRYSDTTCAEWKNEVSERQQWTAAADMLTSARNKGDGGEGLPADSLVDEFRDGVTNACVVETENIAEIAAALYLTERDRFAP